MARLGRRLPVLSFREQGGRLCLRSNRQIDHLRDLRPAVTRSQAFRDYIAEVDHHGAVTLLDRLLGPIGSVFYLAAEKVKKSVSTGIANRLAGTKRLRKR